MPAEGPRVCLTFDFDAISIWPASFGLATPTALSRGEFGARVAVPRILDVLRREGVTATFFIPGHTVETFPAVCRRIVEDGHEVGHHGWMHESPLSLDPAAERAVLERGTASIERVLGVRPAGYRSPSWDLSPHSVPLLREMGFAYDSSMMAQDLEPYRVREGDVLHPDRAFEFGHEVDLVEVPVSWSLDDFPHLEFVPPRASCCPRPASRRRSWPPGRPTSTSWPTGARGGLHHDLPSADDRAGRPAAAAGGPHRPRRRPGCALLRSPTPSLEGRQRHRVDVQHRRVRLRGGGVVGLVGHPAEDRHAADAERPALGHEHVDPAERRGRVDRGAPGSGAGVAQVEGRCPRRRRSATPRGSAASRRPAPARRRPRSSARRPPRSPPSESRGRATAGRSRDRRR